MSAAEQGRRRRLDPQSANEQEREEMRELASQLVRLDPVRGCRIVAPDGQAVDVPEMALEMLRRIAQVLADGDAVSVVTVDKDLTTQQAADLLNVSRQYLVRLLDEGRIACTKTGTHRRVKLQDVMAFKASRDAERGERLDELASISEELGGYEELK